MGIVSALSVEDVRKLAEDVFAGRRKAARPELEINAAASFDGDDAFYITAVFPDGADVPDGREQTRLQSELGKLLIDRGDFRLAYLSALHHSDLEELQLMQAEGLPDA